MSSTDYPPLGSTTLARRALPDSTSYRSTTAAFEAQVDTDLKKVISLELQTIRTETAAAIESHKAQIDAALASIDGNLEQQDTKLNLRLSDSLLLAKVDPLNRSLESL